MLTVIMKHTRKNTTCLQQHAELILYVLQIEISFKKLPRNTFYDQEIMDQQLIQVLYHEI
jgi:uncharacterized protein YlaN (UPF0358 family)